MLRPDPACAPRGPDRHRPLQVASLLGSAQVPMAIRCLGSLLAAADEPLSLVLHDDGSLGDGDRERLAAALGEPEIVSRAEADDRVAPALTGRLALERFRRANPLALKLLDAALLAPGERLAFVDTDVLFLRPCRGLFASPEPEAAVFMADRRSAYSVRSWQVAREPRLALRARVNTGILHVPRGLVDLDLLEWFFGRPDYARTPPWLEQTAWALLAARVPAYLLDPEQVRLAAPDERPEAVPPERVALHFVSPVRDRLSTFDERRPIAAQPPVELRTVPAADATPLRLLGAELARRVGRWR